MAASTDGTPLWVCAGIALALCLTRLGLRLWRRMAFTVGDYWIMGAVVLIGVRMGIGYYIVVYGTPLAISYDGRRPSEDVISSEDYYFLVLDGKLNLVLRAVFVSIYWAFKFAVLDLLSLIVNRAFDKRWVTTSYYVILTLTYLAAFGSIFADCRPLSLNWQIYPDPGLCVQGETWLITYEVGNIVTDFMLLILPFPVIFGARIDLLKRLRVMAIFSLGLFLCAVSILRLQQGSQTTQIQRNRTLWSSIETVVASAVATVPSIYILLRPSPGREERNSPRSRHGGGGPSSSSSTTRRGRLGSTTLQGGTVGTGVDCAGEEEDEGGERTRRRGSRGKDEEAGGFADGYELSVAGVRDRPGGVGSLGGAEG